MIPTNLILTIILTTATTILKECLDKNDKDSSK